MHVPPQTQQSVRDATATAAKIATVIILNATTAATTATATMLLTQPPHPTHQKPCVLACN
eukprot:8269569-Ditylum_brightwellii.AAC.1